MHQAPQDPQVRAEPRFQAPQIRAEPSLATDARLPRPGHCVDLLVPDPRFPRKTLDDRRPSVTAPRPAPRPQRQADPPINQLRWARCPDDGRLHLVQPSDVTLTATRGYAPAVCGHRIAAAGLTINSVASGALCMSCVIAATS